MSSCTSVGKLFVRRQCKVMEKTGKNLNENFNEPSRRRGTGLGTFEGVEFKG